MITQTFPQKEFSMPAWLYQMTANENAGRWWTPKQYQDIVHEGKALTWSTGNIYTREQGVASKGDTIILFFAKSGNPKPGIYGWGKIINPPQMNNDEIKFKPMPPSNFLKINPLWDNEVDELINEIRGVVSVGTIWNVPSKEFSKLSQKIQKHLAK